MVAGRAREADRRADRRAEALWNAVRVELEASLPRSTLELWLDPLRVVSARGSTPPRGRAESVRAWVERRYAATLVAALRRQGAGLTAVEFVDGAPVRRAALPWRRGAGLAAGEPAPDLRRVRDRPGQPPRPLRRARRRRAARRGLQPALPPRPARARQDPPRRRDPRVHGAPAAGAGRPPDDRRAVHQRVRDLAAARRARSVQGALSRGRRAADRRRRVPRGQAADRGGVLPHLQRALLGRQPDRPLRAIARRRPSRGSPSGCATASPGGSPSRSRRPTCRPGSRYCGGSPPSARPLPEPACSARSRLAPPGTSACLEGALTRVIAFSSLLREPLRPDRAARARRGRQARPVAAAARCRPSTRSRAPSAPSPGLSREQCLSAAARPTARARQLAMYVARKHTDLSLAEIARGFSRDHSTVIYAIRNVERALRARLRYPQDARANPRTPPDLPSTDRCRFLPPAGRRSHPTDPQA